MTQPTTEEIARWLREAAESINYWSNGEGNRFKQRAAQVEAMGWRPIEEAPKDGTKVDLWDDELEERVIDCVWKDDRWQFYAFIGRWVDLGPMKCSYFALSPQPPVKK